MSIAQQIINKYEDMACECDDASEANDWLMDELFNQCSKYTHDNKMQTFEFKDRSVLEIEGCSFKLI